MLASIYGILAYVTPGDLPPGWPVPPGAYDRATGAQSLRDGIEQLELADSLGFDWVSFSEHHFANMTMSPNPAQSAAAVIGRVRRAKLALLGPVLPLNNPVRLAEEVAMLDNLAGGRVVVGFLRGTANEFQTYGVNPAETQDRTQESMELILRAWQEPQPFTWEGRYFQYRTVSVWPRPLQQPFPTSYVLGNSQPSCDFAARHHLGLGVSFSDFDVVARSTAYYREQCALAGWQPTPEQVIYRGFVYVGESDEEAQDVARHHWTRSGGTNLTPRRTVAAAVEKVDANPFHLGGAPLPGLAAAAESAAKVPRASINFLGSAETVLREIERCREVVGAGVLDLRFQGPSLDHARTMRSIERFGRDVLPRMRTL